MKRLLCLALIISFLCTAGCMKMLFRGLLGEEATLFTECRWGELERLIENNNADLSSAPNGSLFNLCYAYAKLKNYDKLFSCIEIMQQRINRGDHLVFVLGMPAIDMTPFPSIFKAQAFIEFGDYARAVKEGETAYRFVCASGVGANARESSGGLRSMNRGSGGLQSMNRDFEVWEARAVLALAYALNGDREKALQHAAEMKKMATSSFSNQSGEYHQFPVAKVYVALGDYQTALDLINYAQKQAMLTKAFTLVSGDALVGDIFISNTLPNDFMMSKLLLETGDVDNARKGFDKLLAIPQTAENREVYWMILSDRGRIAETDKDYDHAIELYGRAISVIEEQRSTINTEVNKIGFVGDKQNVYNRMVALLVAQARYPEAFQYVERAKARALVDMLASRDRFAKTDTGPQEVDKLIAKLDMAENESKVQSETLTDAQRAGRRAVVVELKDKIRSTDPELASLVTVSPPDVLEIQRLLPADETLVEYFGSDETLLAFIVNRNNVRAVKLAAHGLRPQIATFRDHIMHPASPRFQTGAQNLYRQLIQPVEGMITTQNITIVPHGELHYLPFNALRSDDGYLIDRYNVRILPSASVMKFLKNRREKHAGDLLALGNPDLGNPAYDLPWAQKEAAVITQGKNDARLLVRGNATETAVKRYGAQFRYVHFATHGTFDPQKPLSSSLLLARDSKNDGRLTVGELYDLDLPADLVTLSACETALGKVANGDDVVGFTRGFLYAGADSIVSSLWKVDDQATAILMQEFYRQLQQKTKRDALRSAQLMVKNRYNAHPYYWAAFQITGAVDR